MKFVKASLSSLASSIVEMIVGVLLLINPVGFTSLILGSFGLVLLLVGVGRIFAYFRTDPEEAAQEGNLAIGLICSLLGFVGVFKTEWIIATFPMITLVYGVISLASGISKLQISMDLVRNKRKYWYVALISAVLTLICALFIICNPFSSTALLWNFTGAALIVEAMADLVTFIFAKKAE